MTAFGSGMNSVNVFMQCPPDTTFSINVTKLIFTCWNGNWEETPDCVPYLKKNGTCPDGYVTVVKFGLSEYLCGMIEIADKLFDLLLLKLLLSLHCNYNIPIKFLPYKFCLKSIVLSFIRTEQLNGKLGIHFFHFQNVTADFHFLFFSARSIFVDHFLYAHAYFIKSDCFKRSLVLKKKNISRNAFYFFRARLQAIESRPIKLV